MKQNPSLSQGLKLRNYLLNKKQKNQKQPFWCWCSWSNIFWAFPSVHYGVVVVAQVIFVTEIGTVTLNKTAFRVINFLKCHLVGFNPFDKIQLSFSYLGNSWDKLTSQGIRNCKIWFKLWKAVFQRQPWCHNPPLYILKPSGFTLSCSHQSKHAFSQGHTEQFTV